MNKKHITTTLFILKILFFWIIFFFFSSGIWVYKNFGKPSFEQILFHFEFGIKHMFIIDLEFLKEFIILCLFGPFIFLFLFSICKKFIISSIRKNPEGISALIFKHYPALLKKFWEKISPKYRQCLKIKFFFLLFFSSVVFFLSKISFWEYLNNSDKGTFIKTHYIAPEIISYPKSKRNLVLVYAESFENLFGSQKVFKENLLESIQEKTHQSITFTNFKQAYGTGWTMAGIVSTQCGIPLKRLTLFGNNSENENNTSFLPSIVCLGDILNKEGYKNIFIGGAPLSFAGKEKFFQEHGYHEIYGVKKWKEMEKWKPHDFHSWGLHDDKLLAYAKTKITELEKKQTPYNLTMLTVDTHAPSGYLSLGCKKKGFKELAGVIECVSDLLADFVSFMEKNGYLKNTNLIILGDHLLMSNEKIDKVDVRERTIFNRFIIPNELKKNRDDLYHFSIFPTILHSLGFKVKEDRAGLGISGLGKIDSDFVMLSIDFDKLTKELQKYSLKYISFTR